MAKKLTKKQKEKVRKFALANWKCLLVLFLIVVLLLVVAYYAGWLDILINKFRKDEEPVLSTAGGYETKVDEFGELKVTFLDVGQADCIIIELPDGKNMIIDGGDFKSDQTIISNYTKDNNINTFHYMLLTHSDRDHVGNLDWVLDNYKVNFIFRPNVYSLNDLSKDIPDTFNRRVDNSSAYICDTDTYAEFIVSAYNEGCVTEYVNKDSDFSNKMICGDKELSYTFDFLTPVANREMVTYKDANNYSPIFTLEYAGKKIMFNGDAEKKMLEEFLTNYQMKDNDVDVLKVGHHGSENATTLNFINEITPEYGVIMCELGNDFKHPHKEALEILENSNMQVYRTDCNGTIILKVSSNGIMNWSLSRTDLTYNFKCGSEMPKTLKFIPLYKDYNFLIDVVSNLRDYTFVRKEVC